MMDVTGIKDACLLSFGSPLHPLLQYQLHLGISFNHLLFLAVCPKPSLTLQNERSMATLNIHA